METNRILVVLLAVALLSSSHPPFASAALSTPPSTPTHHRRRVHQQSSSATAGASGSQSALASAIATNTQAATNAEATGPGASSYGISSAVGQISSCFKGSNQNYSLCRTLAPSTRSLNCTDVPPDDRFSCYQQAVQYGKCNSTFIFLDSFCLKSCGRCGGGGCTDDDAPADGSPCSASQCDSSVYKQKPTCLKTCKRCSVSQD